MSIRKKLKQWKRFAAGATAAVLCAGLLAGCTGKNPAGSSDGTAAQEGPQRYSTIFYDAFDTVTQVIAYCDSEEEFTRQMNALHADLLEYHQLYDIYNDYDGVTNIKTINDNAGTAPVQVDDKILGMLELARQMYNTTDGKLNIARGSVLRIWHDYREAAGQTETDADNKLPSQEELDAAGWTECQISASNSLDEYIIQDLLLQGAKIDVFGVGERMITARSEPVFGGVYKLAAVEDGDGKIIPKIKVSENLDKITIPHFKKTYRIFDNATGKAEADYITVWDETVDESAPLELFDPRATWKRKTYTNFTAKPLQVPVFQGGELVYQLPALPEIQAYCRAQVDTLWDTVKRFENPHTYYVDLSQKLFDIKQDLLCRSR